MARIKGVCVYDQALDVSRHGQDGEAVTQGV